MNTAATECIDDFLTCTISFLQQFNPGRNPYTKGSFRSVRILERSRLRHWVFIYILLEK